jgi:hypothetical protein
VWGEESPEPRASGSLTHRRTQQEWPSDREFKILSIDGGGIKGIFPAEFLSEIEEKYLQGGSIAEHFDLITGTSTGGIIALGLSIGLPARQIAALYVDRGWEIFPPYDHNFFGRMLRSWHAVRQCFRYRYDREALSSLLTETFGDRRFGEARSRLCIPSCDGRYGDVYIFKTPHHPDYKKDQHEFMTTVASATSAAPTFFQPFQSGGFCFVDGGLWANNPIMIGLVDALACYDVDRHRVRILSVGCGDEIYTVSEAMINRGGLLHWKTAINGAMAFQSLNVLGQARLLVGAERVLRVTPDRVSPPIALDDWVRAKEFLPRQAREAARIHGNDIRQAFLERV